MGLSAVSFQLHYSGIYIARGIGKMVSSFAFIVEGQENGTLRAKKQ